MTYVRCGSHVTCGFNTGELPLSADALDIDRSMSLFPSELHQQLFILGSGSPTVASLGASEWVNDQ